MSEVNIFNVYDFVTYEYDLTKNRMFVKWDKNNETINDVMIKEGYQSSTEKRGFMWIDKLKEITQWENGRVITIISSFPDNGKLYIQWETTKMSARHIVIMGDGYFYKRDYTQDYIPLVKVDCLYNDIMDNILSPYILK